MAVLSLTAILIPVVFFVLDISSPNVAGWGNYVRWVGAAAASVVVWEWVERIEALERDENKDGILGREIFDGDEMLQDTPSEVDWRRRPRDDSRGSNEFSGGSSVNRLRGSHAENSRADNSLPSGGLSHIAHSLGWPLRSRGKGGFRKQKSKIDPAFDLQRNTSVSAGQTHTASQSTTPATTISSPVSRTDTISAASTVYRLHYPPVSESTPPSRGTPEVSERPMSTSEQAACTSVAMNEKSGECAAGHTCSDILPKQPGPVSAPWRRMPNPFKRRRASPPPEVSQALATNERSNSATSSAPLKSGTDSQSNTFLKFLHRGNPKSVEIPLPTTVIPWQPRGRACLDRIEEGMASPEPQAEHPESQVRTLPGPYSRRQLFGDLASTEEGMNHPTAASSQRTIGHPRLAPSPGVTQSLSAPVQNKQLRQHRTLSYPPTSSAFSLTGAVDPGFRSSTAPSGQITESARDLVFVGQPDMLSSGDTSGASKDNG